MYNRVVNTPLITPVMLYSNSLRKTPQFHRMFCCENFVERQSFRTVSGELVTTHNDVLDVISTLVDTKSSGGDNSLRILKGNKTSPQVLCKW